MTAGKVGAALGRGETSWFVPPIAAIVAVVPAAGWSVPDARGLPFTLVWAVLAAVGLVGFAAVIRRRPRPLETTAIVVGAAVLVGDVTLVPTQLLRDLDLYLRAGSAWSAGRPVYLDHVLTSVPADRSLYPYLYPPLTLPFAGALAALPSVVVHVTWPIVSIALAFAALRVLRLPWRWALAALFWRPFAEGLWVGNVGVPLLAAFVLAPRAGSLLALPALFKVYMGLPMAWLLRERRWRDLALAGGLSAGLALATLPLVGVAAWPAWVEGLGWWTRSISVLGSDTSGFALGRWLPVPVGLVLVAVVVVLALRFRGRDGLWRLGVATPIASPAVYSHGLLLALPALLGLRPFALAIAIAATAAAPGPVFWLAPALAVASWFLPAFRSKPGACDPGSSGESGGQSVPPADATG